MRRPYALVWWLIVPVCSTVVTGLRLAAIQEQPGWRPGIAGQPALLHPPEAAARQQPARPAWTKHIGQYRLVKWHSVRAQRETIVLRDGAKRSVARISGFWVEVVLIRDLTGDGFPDVVLRAWSGGMHGSFVYYVYSLGPKPRCLLAYDKENFDSEVPGFPDFEMEDLDRDRRQEIVSWYDGFECGGPAAQWYSSCCGSARVPIVLGYVGGRYVDLTSRHRGWLVRRLSQTKERFLADLDEAEDAGLTGDRSQGMVQYYCIAALLHGPATARRMVLSILPRKYHSVFLKNCRLIEQVLADRRKRYAYPPAYSRVQAFASEALPPDADDATQTDSGATPASHRNSSQ